MSIRGAVGLGLTIIVLKFLLGGVFSAVEDTVVRSLNLANIVIEKAEMTAQTGQFLQLPVPQIK